MAGDGPATSPRNPREYATDMESIEGIKKSSAAMQKLGEHGGLDPDRDS